MTIVFDLSYDEFKDNKIFRSEIASRYPGLSWLPKFSVEAKLRGWDVITSDRYLNGDVKDTNVFCITDMVTPDTPRLLRAGVKPLLVFCPESPNIALNFYARIETYSRSFRHAMLFRGVKERIAPHVTFHTYYWPNAERAVRKQTGSWSDRKLIVTVASNKTNLTLRPGVRLASLRIFIKKLILRYLPVKYRFAAFRNLYDVRIDAIKYFSKKPGFNLFGTRWTDTTNLDAEAREAVKKAGGVPVDDKIETLMDYKFNLCFENCVFPGYVTEKIFDGLFAGCIPIYYGAPDITDFVPADCFIDFRNFNDFEALDVFVRNLTEVEAKKYLEAAERFLNSRSFDKFFDDHMVQVLVNILENEKMTPIHSDEANTKA